MLGEDGRGLLRGLLPLPWWGSSLGTWGLCAVTASVILSRVTDTEVLPSQVERVDGEGGGDKGGAEEGGQMPRQMGQAGSSAQPNALPSRPSGGSVNEAGDGIWDDSRTRLINQA